MAVSVPSSMDRVGAKVIDEILIFILALPALIPIFSVEGAEWIPWGLVAYLLAVPLAYEALAYWIFSQTVGKWIFSLRVNDSRDPHRPVELSRFLLRVLISRLSVFVSWAPQATAFFRYDRTHLADWLAGTRVVSLRPRPKRAVLHPWWGIFLVIFFIETGLSSAAIFWSQLDWSSEGVTWGFQADQKKS